MSGKSVLVFVLLCGVVFVPVASAPLRAASSVESPRGGTNLDQVPAHLCANDNEGFNDAIYEKNNEVNQLIALADSLAREGEWQPAITHYQQALDIVLDQRSAGLVTVADAAEPDVSYARPYDMLIRERLLSMDSTEIAYYRGQYEHRAASALADARQVRNFAAMVDVAKRWALTESGQKAAADAGAIALERGDFFTAARLYLDLAEVIKAWPPFSPAAYAAALAGAACAYSNANSRIGLDRVEALAKANPAACAARVRHGGKALTLDACIALLSKSVERPAPAVLRDWPTLGGDFTRARSFADGVGKIGGVMWRYEIDYENKAMLGYAGKVGGRFADALVAPVPVYSDGCLYANTGYGLVALDGFVGNPLFAKHPGNVEMKRVFYREKQDKIDAATVHDGIIYGVSSTGTLRYQFIIVTLRKMIAVDSATGDVLWDSIEQTGLNKEDLVCSAPAVYRDSVIFQVRRIEDIYFRYYLVCADAKTGALRWRTPLAATPLSTERHYSDRGAANVAAVSGNIAVVQSSASTITAVDLDSGRIIWGMKYNCDFISHTSQQEHHKSHQALTCTANPPMIVGDRVIVKPSDSFRVMCLRLDDGRLLWSKRDSRISYIAGVDGESLFVVGPGVTERNINTGDKIFGEEYQTLDKDGNVGYRLAPLTGRPALVRDALYISTREALYRFDRATRKLEKTFDWVDREMLPGNLLITPDGFFVANSEEVVAFYVPAIIDTITRQLKDNPGDPLLLLRRAAGLLAFGRAQEALTDLDLALEKSDPQQQYGSRPLRETIAVVKSRCYSALAASQTDPRKAVEMAQLAVQNAVERERLVEATCALAERQAALGAEGLPQAVASLQKILAECPDETMRFGKHFRQSPANYAANRLGAFLREHGRACYAATEAEAQKRYDAALQTSSRKEMLEVYRLYPNSIACLRAIAWLTASKNGGGGPGFEAAALRVALDRYIDTPEIAPWLVRLQQIARDAGDHQLETRTLDRLASLPPGTTLSVDDREVATGDYAKKRLAEIARLIANDGTQTALPANPAIQFEDTYETVNFKSQARVNFLLPDGLRPEVAHDKILLRRGSVVECVSLKTGKRLWRSHPSRQWLGLSIKEDEKNKSQILIQAIYAGQNAQKAGLRVNDILLTINDTKINSFMAFRKALDALKPGDMAQVEVLRGNTRMTVSIVAESIPASFTSNISHARYMGRDRLVIVATLPNLELRCIDLRDGKTAWERTGLAANVNRSVLPEPVKANAGSLWANGLFSYFDPTGGGAIVTIDLNDGREVARFKIDKREFTNFAVAGGMYLVQHGDKCVARDILSGALRYEFALMPIDQTQSINRAYANRAIVTTADRALVFPDYRHNIIAVDLCTATEMTLGPMPFNSVINYRLRMQRSERHIMVFDMANSAQGLSVSSHIIDGLRFEARRNVDLIASPSNMAFYDKTVLLPIDNILGNLFAVYNLETGAVFYGKRQSKDQYQGLHLHRPTGRYYVFAGCNSKPASPPPAAPRPPQKNESELSAVVIEAATGKEIYKFTRSTNYRSFLDVQIIDGRLCVIHGYKMIVLGESAPAE